MMAWAKRAVSAVGHPVVESQVTGGTMRTTIWPPRTTGSPGRSDAEMATSG